MRDWLDVARGSALLLIPGAFVTALVMVAVMGIASLATREHVGRERGVLSAHDLAGAILGARDEP